jgi:hypothetical protein
MAGLWIGRQGGVARARSMRRALGVAVSSTLASVLGCTTLPTVSLPLPISIFAPAKPHMRLCGRDFTLPDGWRLPTPTEVEDAWRRDDPGRFLAAYGDLNGDGVPDQAQLLLRTDGVGFGVFVFLCEQDGTILPHLVLHNQEAAYFRRVGIKPVAPGLYRTACGKNYMECYPGEPREIRLRHEALDYFKRDEVASLFYWSDTAASFRWVAITD